MRIADFERAFRAATRQGDMEPALATPGAGILTNHQIPEEFQAAAKTLAERSVKPHAENRILGAAAQWT